MQKIDIMEVFNKKIWKLVKAAKKDGVTLEEVAKVNSIFGEMGYKGEKPLLTEEQIQYCSMPPPSELVGLTRYGMVKKNANQVYEASEGMGASWDAFSQEELNGLNKEANELYEEIIKSTNRHAEIMIRYLIYSSIPSLDQIMSNIELVKYLKNKGIELRKEDIGYIPKTITNYWLEQNGQKISEKISVEFIIK